MNDFNEKKNHGLSVSSLQEVVVFYRKMVLGCTICMSNSSVIKA